MIDSNIEAQTRASEEPSMNLRIYVGLVALVVAIIGIIGLFSGVSAAAGGGRIDCGSSVSSNMTTPGSLEGAGRDIAEAMQGNFQADYSTSYASACDTAVGMRQLWAWPLTGLGLVVAVGAMIAERKARDKAWADKRRAAQAT